MNRMQNPKLIGFLVGFGGVSFIGLIVIVVWVIFGGALSSPSPTLVPSAAPVSERLTVVPPAPERAATPSPTVGSPSTPMPPPTPTSLAPTPTRGEAIEFTVREGDTLFDLALAYGLSVETLQDANDLDGETIRPGQVLIIPPGPLPTPTPYVEGDTIVHTVSRGETLIGIAKQYSVTVEMIQTANELTSETIQPGWELRIPAEVIKRPTPTATTPAEMPWQPSTLEGDLEAAYPLTLDTDRFTLRYQPDTPAARAPAQLRRLVESALSHIEDELDVRLEDEFDVYIAGSLFASPDTALRGRSFSAGRRNFYLYDDTGTLNERRYVITHELTHLVIWNTVGSPSSVMLHEGVAVYTGVEASDAAGFIPLSHFCAAYQQADQLPSLSRNRDYLGHIRDLDLYNAAGCFVQYLIEEYGLSDFKQLFTSGDYPGIYGRTQSQLEQEWIDTLDATGQELTFEAERLVTFVEQVADAYDRLFDGFSGTSSQMAAYHALDQARIAVLQARFDEAQDHLTEFEELLQGE